MKEIKLNFIQWGALLTKALIRNVFPSPREGQLHFKPPSLLKGPDGDVVIYMNVEYYDKLHNALKEAERAGKFRSSNAEDEWIELLRRFNIAQDVNKIDIENMQEWI